MLSDKTINAMTGISKATLQKGVRIKHLFRIMTHCPDLWMMAYAKIYANKGALTKGVDGTSLDGMCQDRIENLINLLKDGRYRPKPAKRVYIPKSNGKLRPLGMPTGDDKMVQEVVRILLETIYEPVFSDKSHGFRPERSCHTALTQIEYQWKGVKWIVDMDISGFFDNIDHRKMIDVLEKKIDDKRFIALIEAMLKAGYFDEWKFHGTYSGTPQGGICSPVLANAILHELDKFMESKAEAFNKGKARKSNPVHGSLSKKIKLRRDEHRLVQSQGGCFTWHVDELQKEIKALEKERFSVPSSDPYDKEFKRLYYVRYADDFAAGVIGSKEDAQNLANDIEEFLLKELNLKIAADKSGIRHSHSGFDFLGYHIQLSASNQHVVKGKYGMDKDGNAVYRNRRTVHSKPWLQVPKEKVWAFCRKKEYLVGTKPSRRPKLLHLSEYEIVATYNAEMRGFANYYTLAPKENLYVMEWAGLSSLFHTLANKRKTSVAAVVRRLKCGDEHILRYKINGQEKRLVVFKIKHRAVERSDLITDQEPNIRMFDNRNEITRRMEAGKCEYCGKTGGYFEVHHVRKLKDIANKKEKAQWEIHMISRRRKTMVLCKDCHTLLHTGKLQGWKRDSYTEAESPVQ